MKKLSIISTMLIVLQVHAGTLNYTFDEASPLAAAVSDLGNTTVSPISYTQGTTQSGGGYSDVAYESNVPGDNLFAISSVDVGAAHVTYQTADSRLQFSLDVAAGGTLDFTGSSLSFDLFAMNASIYSYIVNARVFYNINDTGWVDLSGAFHQINTSTATLDHTLNTQLYADSTDALLTGSISAEADVYEKNFSIALDSIGTLSSGDTIEFALFIWDSVNGNASFYTGTDNIMIDGLAVTQLQLDAAVSYTFNQADPLAAETDQTGNTIVSSISYVQGSTQSGGGYSDVAYESNVPGENLFAISSVDIGTSDISYQTNDTKFLFGLTVGAGESMQFFDTSTLSFDLIAMNASVYTYIVSAKIFYNVNGSGWLAMPIDGGVNFHQISTSVATLDHLLNTELYANATDEKLVGSISESANVYIQNFSVSLDPLGSLSTGDSVEFALFVWDNVDGNASYYTGVDNINIDNFAVISPAIGNINLDMLSVQNGLVISWESVSGVSYAVEGCSDLIPGGWVPVTNNIFGTGETISYTGEVSGVQNFYRVVVE